MVYSYFCYPDLREMLHPESLLKCRDLPVVTRHTSFGVTSVPKWSQDESVTKLLFVPYFWICSDAPVGNQTVTFFFFFEQLINFRRICFTKKTVEYLYIFFSLCWTIPTMSNLLRFFFSWMASTRYWKKLHNLHPKVLFLRISSA